MPSGACEAFYGPSVPLGWHCGLALRRLGGYVVALLHLPATVECSCSPQEDTGDNVTGNGTKGIAVESSFCGVMTDLCEGKTGCVGYFWEGQFHRIGTFSPRKRLISALCQPAALPDWVCGHKKTQRVRLGVWGGGKA